MHLLRYAACVALLAGLVCAQPQQAGNPYWLAASAVLAAEDEAAAQAPADPAATAPTADTAEPDDGADAETATAEDTESSQPGDPPEGVKRTRPKTAEAERDYKLRKTREDPFLNPDAVGGNTSAEPAFFDPAAHLEPIRHPYKMGFLVQDKQGTVAGYLTIDVGFQTERAKDDTLLISKLSTVAPKTEIKLLLDSQTFKPRQLVRNTLNEGSPAPAGATGWEASTELPRSRAEYLFDRVRVVQSSGAISVSKLLRQLPFSYDVETLPVLMSQLSTTKMDWPFEAAVTDISQMTSLPLRIPQPEHVDVLSAEPAQYKCLQFMVQAGKTVYEYDVQSTWPYKLVRFTDGLYTYKLFEYASR